ncbi:MAG: diguanylate cyclase [Anaerolineales bacterium]|nr:diguanylate cyclase [Anaerolineales bacterium]
MNFSLDNRTQAVVQIAVSIMLCVVMWTAWRTQKTFPGFGRWTVSKIPHAIGWLLLSLRGSIPDWASIIVANALILTSPILLYEGIRQFRGKPHQDMLHYGVMVLFIGLFSFFTFARPSMNARLAILSICLILVFTRCIVNLIVAVPRELRSSHWFTAAMFSVFDLVMILRLITMISLPALPNPFNADIWQQALFLATIVLPIGGTFGFFMMTNDRLTMELRAAEKEMHQMAMTDFLTGAFNRRAFTEMGMIEYERSRRYGRPLAFLFIDLDHFKIFNDKYGHLGGDVMLQKVVAALHENLRAVDILARWGGEEFAIFLPETSQAGCLQVAEKLRNTISDLSVSFEGEHMKVTVSIGCTIWRQNGESLDAVFSRADGALYQAKQQGRNRVLLI